MRMQAVRETSKEMSLNKALQYCGMSKHAWHYTKKSRDVMINAEVTDKVREISSKRPTYGTRRMAVQVPCIKKLCALACKIMRKKRV